MDGADVAQSSIERDLDARISARVVYEGASANECQNPDCGVLISSARQIAVPGCQYCIECAALIEAQASKFGRSTRGVAWPPDVEPELIRGEAFQHAESSARARHADV